MKKKYLIGLIMFLVVGFAAVTTTLIINGKTLIGMNLEEFEGKIYFSRAKTEDTGKAEITDQGKNINYETSKLTDLEQTSTLTFEVTNDSKLYDAQVKISCALKNPNDPYKDYVTISAPENMRVNAKTKEVDKIQVTLKKLLIDDVDIELKCEFEATPIEREKEAVKENENSLLVYIQDQARFGTDDLIYDDTKDQNIRYYGEDVDNYITFNNETWRIIGVMNNVTTSDGDTEDLVKIVREEYTEKMPYNSFFINAADTSEVLRYLNTGDYYDSLSDEAKELIEEVEWKISDDVNVSDNALSFYNHERNLNKMYGNPTYIGKVAMMYPSDLMYSIGGSGRKYDYGRVNPDDFREQCWASSNSKINWYCYDSSWLVLGYNYDAPSDWLLGGSSTNAYQMALHHSVPVITNFTVTDKLVVKPTLYLKASTIRVDGTGDINDPFTIARGPERTKKVEPKEKLEKGTFINLLDNLNSNDFVEDQTTDKNKRFVGEDPNNYVLFNGEKWRIIGIMNNITTSSGNKTSLVKIVKSDPLDEQHKWWGFRPMYNWTTSELNKYLNVGEYYQSLSETSKKMIQSVQHKIGYSGKYSTNIDEFYTSERSSYSIYNFDVSNWSGKIVLPYFTDYIFSVGGDERDKCVYQSNFNDANWHTNFCYDYAWLWLHDPNLSASKSLLTFTISQITSTDFALLSTVVNNSSNAYLSQTSLANDGYVLPTLYLKPGVNIKEGSDGDGSFDKPYELEI